MHVCFVVSVLLFFLLWVMVINKRSWTNVNSVLTCYLLSFMFR